MKIAMDFLKKVFHRWENHLSLWVRVFRPMSDYIITTHRFFVSLLQFHAKPPIFSSHLLIYIYMTLFSKGVSAGGGTGTASSSNSRGAPSKSRSSLASNMFAPRQLIQQILVMQGIYYFIGFCLILFTCIVSGDPFSLSTVFSWEPVRIDTTMGWTLFLLWLLDTFFSVLALTVVVGRSKMALDFTLTLHGIHLVVCWCVAGKFPASRLWWGLQVLSVLLMVLLGTWTTQWRELRATFFEPGAEGSLPVIRGLGSASNTTTPATTRPGPAVSSIRGPAVSNQEHYDEFELQETPSISVPFISNVASMAKPQRSAFDPIDDLEDSEDEGDLTAGSKLLRDTERRY